VVGDRRWESFVGFLRPGPPDDVTRVPLVYERAFGGSHAHPKTGALLGCASNPVGCGFRGKRPAAAMLDEPLPSFEADDDETPAALGPIAPHWAPRLSFVGTYDEHWQQTRAPYLPDDFDDRFFHCAHPSWVFAGGLAPFTPIEAEGFSPRGPIAFSLPRCELSVRVQLRDRTVDVEPRLETVALRLSDDRMSLSYRAAIPCDKRALQIDDVIVSLRALELA
jgi:hypothetical protein